MKKVGAIIGPLILLISLVACGQNSGVSPDEYKKIKKGMTQAEVEELIGAPKEKEESYPESWIYKGKDGIESDSTVKIEFSEEQEVRAKYQTNLFDPPKVEEDDNYKADGELLDFIITFNSLVDEVKDLDLWVEPISTENLEKKKTTFFDGQDTHILISDPEMVDELNRYTNKIDFTINEEENIKTIYYAGGTVDYPLLILQSLNISKDTIDQIVHSFSDVDLETLESKSFDVQEESYHIELNNGTPRFMKVTKEE